MIMSRTIVFYHITFTAHIPETVHHA